MSRLVYCIYLNLNLFDFIRSEQLPCSVICVFLPQFNLFTYHELILSPLVIVVVEISVGYSVALILDYEPSGVVVHVCNCNSAVVGAPYKSRFCICIRLRLTHVVLSRSFREHFSEAVVRICEYCPVPVCFASQQTIRISHICFSVIHRVSHA